ncbi:SNARE protein TLG1/Syntaxin 6 [Ceraceosorus bombacis]|uniref:SNARE protein TLG1/Syntaxin 6 n=1 Tax=Ceraceosorus bombacis TaxID=401625 RepID=A0A0P1BFV4_9BASI|nr:SNARE protein TLG1/Syntaxin 6 [Ceraceosorus bombacis]
MATDPYHSFAAELRNSLRSAQELAGTYSKGSASSTNTDTDSQRAAHDALVDALEALEADIADVRESVNVVSRSPERFGLDEQELGNRRRFVKDCEEQFKRLSKVPGERPTTTRKYAPDAGDADADLERGASRGDDDVEAFEREQQQSLLAQQDNTLSLIGRSLTSLRTQASAFGTEIAEQVELVGALDSEVDTSQSRLKRAMGRLDEIARRSDDRCGGWCVWLLVVALMFVLLLVILI